MCLPQLNTKPTVVAFATHSLLSYLPLLTHTLFFQYLYDLYRAIDLLELQLAQDTKLG